MRGQGATGGGARAKGGGGAIATVEERGSGSGGCASEVGGFDEDGRSGGSAWGREAREKVNWVLQSYVGAYASACRFGAFDAGVWGAARQVFCGVAHACSGQTAAAGCCCHFEQQIFWCESDAQLGTCA